MQPTDHDITILDRHDKQICGRVVYLQPKEERQRQGSAVVHIVTIDLLGPHVYSAIYASPTQAVLGTYIVHGYADAGDHWLFKGTFHRVQDGEWLRGE